MIRDIKTSRRETLTGAAGAAAAMAFGSSSAEAQGTGFVIPPVTIAALAIAGGSQLFPVRRIYCVGRNYLEHIREEGNDEREPPFFFQKPRDALKVCGPTL